MKSTLNKIAFTAAFGFAFVLHLSCGEVGGGESPDNKGAYVEEAGGYSFVPPAKFQVDNEFTQRINSSYKVFLAPTDTDYVTGITYIPNIAFSDTLFEDVSLDDFVNIFISVGGTKPDVNIISKTDFLTKQNLKVYKVKTTIEVHIENRTGSIMQYYYFLSRSNGTIMTILCSALAIRENVYDRLFDDSIKTFEWVD